MLEPLPFTTRLWFAWVCFFRVLFDPGFAARAFEVRAGMPALPAAAPEPEPDPVPAPSKPAAVEPAAVPPTARPDHQPALQLLALLQREGRFVDFLEQDIAAFPDAEVGAAARVIHEGCRKALREHVAVAPVRAEAEGATLTLEAGFSPSEVKLTGDVKGTAPYRGVLRHRGWRATRVSLPVPMKGHDAAVLAPAEVEL